MAKTTLGGKGLFGLHFFISAHHQRRSAQELNQDKNLKAEAGAEAMERSAYCLAPHGFPSLLSY